MTCGRGWRCVVEREYEENWLYRQYCPCCCCCGGTPVEADYPIARPSKCILVGRTSVVCMAVWRCCRIIINRNLCLHRYVCAVLQLMLHQLQQCVEYVDVKAFSCTFDLSNCLAAIVIPLQQHDLSFAFLRQWRDDSTTWN